MRHHYKDILSRIAEPPTWWDEHCVPRWDDFKPGQCANVYANEVLLMVVACQACGREFEACQSWTSRFNAPASLSTIIRNGRLEFGDPPNIGCCPSGPTMTADSKRVLQFWIRNGFSFEWRRVPEFEIQIED